jgi:regulator of replication initiation timing
MKYELLPEQIVSIFGYPEPLLEESVVKAAVQELVDDRKKLLADKRALMLEVKQLKERLRTLEGLHEEDANTYQESPEHSRDASTAGQPLRWPQP